MRSEWQERVVRGAEAVFSGVLYGFLIFVVYSPWLAAIVIGGGLTWFQVVCRHHPLWVCLPLCLGIPLLLAWLLHREYRDGNGSRVESGCGCGLLPLLLFLIMWPVFLQAYHKAAHLQAAQEKARHHAPLTPPHR
jgi:hypothetical protein